MGDRVGTDTPIQQFISYELRTLKRRVPCLKISVVLYVVRHSPMTRSDRTNLILLRRYSILFVLGVSDRYSVLIVRLG